MKYRTGSNCLNCGAQLIDKYCHHCGQPNIETRENVFHLVAHFISDYLHFDSKFFRSLKSLFVRPGFLTRQYWDGKRVSFIHPLRLFFFITIIFMIAITTFYRNFGPTMKKSMIHHHSIFRKYDSARLATLPDTARIIEPGFLRDTLTGKQLKEWWVEDDSEYKKLEAGFDNFFTNLKYATFFLLPVYALVFQLVYIRRRTFYVDQLVYTLHLQSFAYCVMGIVLLLPFLFPAILNQIIPIVILILLVYIGFSLHYLYKQPWWKTILKSLITTMLLVIITALAMAFFAVINAEYFQ